MSNLSPPSDVMDISMDGMDRKAVEAADAAAVAVAGVVAMSHPHIPPAAMEQVNSPHGSESSYHSAPRASTTLDTLSGRSYVSPHTSVPMSGPGVAPGLMMAGVPSIAHGLPTAFAKPTNNPQAPIKAYPCSTCTKGFARRSDLARHERIHNNDRPHKCDWPDCGKRFIQRSALTVHQRTHTKEKPHRCERCGKPFSDSSSLARHRRIHTGNRPYRCPYADCQKTFTRRTTLTRHEKNHKGTLEEAAAATAAVLAEQASKAAAAAQSARSDGEHNAESLLGSAHGSPLNTPSPSQTHMSASPGVDVTVANAVRSNDLGYMGNGTLPVHIRADVHGTGTATTPPFSSGMRPTSHPNTYQPPQTLEPTIEPQQSTSVAVSPHLGSVGWQSPSHQSPAPIPSPTNSNGGGSAYVYPDPDQSFAAAGLNQVYYGTSNQMSRSDSAEAAGSYDAKPRPDGSWTGDQ
ncbi:hypothetical protein F5Y16DRAFT_94160 [Xylariaceae sp. FL0255]|nr:hypothetical protein F5Y16DRAFT_94160 [Xylariaceae sp. FL0255]